MTKEELAKINPPTVKRNNVELKLTTQVFSPKSDEFKGKVFFTPELETPKLAYITEDVNGTPTQVPVLRDINSFLWCGLDQIVGATNKVLRGVFGRICIDIYKDPANNGVFNMEDFMEDAPDFTAARESLSNIQEEYEDLVALQTNFAMDDAYQEAMATGIFPPELVEIQKQVKANAVKIKALKAKKEYIEKIYAERAATRKANKEKKEAEAAAKKAQHQHVAA